ncbi:MAG: CoA transferase [Granulosicoccus sp.]|nr:CoA transferase [Granulosicoccus sp.]
MIANAASLAGIRVLDLSRVLAGPFCAQTLGDLGAEVIKVERPKSGDDTRGWGPPFQEGEAAYFMCANRNKQSITLDLKSAKGKEILGKLIACSDVVIENFKVGTLASWGFDQAWFEEYASRTICCSITGYGSVGEKAKLPGYDFLAQAESGLMSITGSIDGQPVKYGVSIVDFCTGQYAAIAILSALQARHDTGRGQHIECNLYSTGLAMLINVGSSHLMSGKPARRLGNGHPNSVPYREFDCSDGRIALPVGNDNQFRNLARVLGKPEWADDERFKTIAARVKHREQVDSMLQAVFSTNTSASWLTSLQAAGVACSQINTVADALANPHTKACNMVVEVEHSTAGPVKLLGVPYKMSDTPAGITRPPPALGEHTSEVLSSILGMEAVEIDSLKSDGVI